jgi:autophagy-related protein 2
LGSGVADLVLLPIEQYRKDGRLARGIQRGVTSFSKTTTLEALNVGARLATGTQVILEQAEAVLGARINSVPETEAFVLSDAEREELISRYAQQPGDFREGVESAYRSLGGNLRSAAQTILAVPMDVYERSGTEVRSFLASQIMTLVLIRFLRVLFAL